MSSIAPPRPHDHRIVGGVIGIGRERERGFRDTEDYQGYSSNTFGVAGAQWRGWQMGERWQAGLEYGDVQRFCRCSSGGQRHRQSRDRDIWITPKERDIVN